MAGRIRRFWQGPISLGIAILVGLAIVIMLIIVLVNHHNSPAAPKAAQPSASASPQPKNGDGFVTLPKPTGTTSGYPTKYPHTTLGAVATVLAYEAVNMRVLDYQQGAQVVNAYFTQPPVSARQGGSLMAESHRKICGMPLSGASAPGASAQAQMDGVRWATAGNTVQVFIEGTITCTEPNGSTRTIQTATGPNTAVWKGGRWWINGPSMEAAHAVPYAKPGSKAFDRAGWSIIENSDWTGSSSGGGL